MKNSNFTGHIDFALFPEEIGACASCDKKLSGPFDSQYGNDYIVAPKIRNPVYGLIVKCGSCQYNCRRPGIVSKWRKTAPRQIPVLPGLPVKLIARGYHGEDGLLDAIRYTIDHIPEKSRRRILDYVSNKDERYRMQWGLRFEALPRWCTSRNYSAQNLLLGHAIRFRVSYLEAANRDDLVETIAHELAHTEQHADGVDFGSDNNCELDVEERIARWGLGRDSKESVRKDIRTMIAETTRGLQAFKQLLGSCKMPSGNYAGASLMQMQKAANAIERATMRWVGFDDL